jgi:N-methylhydantoinase B
VDVRLQRGDRFVMRTSGGGGLGPPEARARAQVVADIESGRVTREAAALDYRFESDE